MRVEFDSGDKTGNATLEACHPDGGGRVIDAAAGREIWAAQQQMHVFTRASGASSPSRATHREPDAGALPTA